jgi:hypothetical protein
MTPPNEQGFRERGSVRHLEVTVENGGCPIFSVRCQLHEKSVYDTADGITNKNAVVESLTTLRARIDVQTARIASLDDQIREQTAATVALSKVHGLSSRSLI